MAVWSILGAVSEEVALFAKVAKSVGLRGCVFRKSILFFAGTRMKC